MFLRRSARRATRLTHTARRVAPDYVAIRSTSRPSAALGCFCKRMRWNSVRIHSPRDGHRIASELVGTSGEMAQVGPTLGVTSALGRSAGRDASGQIGPDQIRRKNASARHRAKPPTRSAMAAREPRARERGQRARERRWEGARSVRKRLTDAGSPTATVRAVARGRLENRVG